MDYTSFRWPVYVELLGLLSVTVVIVAPIALLDTRLHRQLPQPERQRWRGDAAVPGNP